MQLGQPTEKIVLLEELGETKREQYPLSDDINPFSRVLAPKHTVDALISEGMWKFEGEEERESVNTAIGVL